MVANSTICYKNGKPQWGSIKFGLDYGFDIFLGFGFGVGFSITLRLGWIMDLKYFSDSDLELDLVLPSGWVGLWIQYIHRIWIRGWIH